MASFNSETKILFNHFISVAKKDATSLESFKTHETNFSLSMPVTEWATLSKRLVNSEDDRRFVLDV